MGYLLVLRNVEDAAQPGTVAGDRVGCHRVKQEGARCARRIAYPGEAAVGERMRETRCKRAGEVQSRAVIADQVWDMNFDSETNVVEVAIRRLRTKLDDPYPLKLLHTVRGIGYVLEDRT